MSKQRIRRGQRKRTQLLSRQRWPIRMKHAICHCHAWQIEQQPVDLDAVEDGLLEKGGFDSGNANSYLHTWSAFFFGCAVLSSLSTCHGKNACEWIGYEFDIDTHTDTRSSHWMHLQGCPTRECRAREGTVKGFWGGAGWKARELLHVIASLMSSCSWGKRYVEH